MHITKFIMLSESEPEFEIRIASKKAMEGWKQKVKECVKSRINEELTFGDKSNDVGFELTHVACLTSFWVVEDASTGETFEFDDYYDCVSGFHKEAWLDKQVQLWNKIFLEVMQFLHRRADQLYTGDVV